VPVTKATTGTTTISAIAGNTQIDRNVAVRLTAAGVAAVATALASDAYQSTITLVLTTD
jgi:hypothetical protein